MSQKKAIRFIAGRYPVALVGLCFFILLSYFVYGFVGLYQRSIAEGHLLSQSTDEGGYRFSSARIPILMYHYVERVKDGNDTTRESLAIAPEVFEKQLNTLLANDFTFITTSQLGMSIDGKIPLVPRPVIISFDDGYEDFYTDVFPLLKKYRVRAVAYISYGLLDKKNYMHKWQLREVVQSGLVEIAAHTVNHVNLAYSFYPTALDEIVQSKILLEKEFGVKVSSFAYPYGSYSDQIIVLVKNTGYTTAVTTDPGIQQRRENRYTLFRLRPGKRVGTELVEYFNQTTFKPW